MIDSPLNHLRNKMRLSRLRVKGEPHDLFKFGWNAMVPLKPFKENPGD